MTVKELKEFIFENCYTQIQCPNENSYYSLKNQKKKSLLLLPPKLIKKYLILIMDKNTKDHFCKTKNKKLVRWPKIITQQSKVIEHQVISDITSVKIEHQKTSHILSKATKQTKQKFCK